MSETSFSPIPIGGWLILVGIGVVLGPIIMLFQLVPLYTPLFADGVLSELSDKSGEFYDPGLLVFLGVEMSLNAMIFAASLYLIFLFFSRRANFPKTYIFLSLFVLAFIVVDAAASVPFLGLEWTGVDGAFDPTTLKEVAKSAISSAIWVPYMFVSTRVQDTFTQ